MEEWISEDEENEQVNNGGNNGQALKENVTGNEKLQKILITKFGQGVNRTDAVGIGFRENGEVVKVIVKFKNYIERKKFLNAQEEEKHDMSIYYFMDIKFNRSLEVENGVLLNQIIIDKIKFDSFKKDCIFLNNFPNSYDDLNENQKNKIWNDVMENKTVDQVFKSIKLSEDDMDMIYNTLNARFAMNKFCEALICDGGYMEKNSIINGIILNTIVRKSEYGNYIIVEIGYPVGKQGQWSSKEIRIWGNILREMQLKAENFKKGEFIIMMGIVGTMKPKYNNKMLWSIRKYDSSIILSGTSNITCALKKIEDLNMDQYVKSSSCSRERYTFVRSLVDLKVDESSTMLLKIHDVVRQSEKYKRKLICGHEEGNSVCLNVVKYQRETGDFICDSKLPYIDSHGIVKKPTYAHENLIVMLQCTKSREVETFIPIVLSTNQADAFLRQPSFHALVKEKQAQLCGNPAEAAYTELKERMVGQLCFIDLKVTHHAEKGDILYVYKVTPLRKYNTRLSGYLKKETQGENIDLNLQALLKRTKHMQISTKFMVNYGKLAFVLYQSLEQLQQDLPLLRA